MPHTPSLNYKNFKQRMYRLLQIYSLNHNISKEKGDYIKLIGIFKSLHNQIIIQTQTYIQTVP